MTRRHPVVPIVLLSLALLLSGSVAIGAGGDCWDVDADTVGSFEITSGTSGTDYTYSGGVLTVNDGANITISMASGATTPTNDRIAVAENATATITLNGINITGTSYNDSIPASSPIDLEDGATLTLVLSDNSTNILTGGAGGTGDGAPGIHVPGDATLIIQGGGSLSLTGGASNTGQAGTGIGGKAGEISGGGYGPGENCGTVIILGGTIQITGGNSNAYPGAAGIGGGNSDSTGGNGGTVIILSDTATVKGGSGFSSSTGADIGGGSGVNESNDGQGIMPSGSGSYNVYGDVTLPDGITITIPEDATLNIPGNASLTVPEGTTLTNNGTITGQGSLMGSGDLTNNGTVSVSNNDFMATVEVSVSPSSAAYNSNVTLTATVTSSSEEISGGTVTFYQGEANDSNKLNEQPATVTSGTATTSIQLTGSGWTPSESPYTITAVYTPAADSSLIGSSGTATLTVTKATQGTGPSAPTVSTTTPPTATSITLAEITATGQGGVQYGYTTDGGSASDISNWQAGTTFGNLIANTAYTFYARYAGNENYEPSPASTGTMIYTAHATPATGDGYTINYTDETVTASNGHEVRLTESNDWTTSPINITPGGSFQVRHAATQDGAPASEPQTVNVAARPTAPTLIIDTKAEGVEFSSDYFYNTTGETATGWTQGTGEVVHVDPSTTIYIYKAATDSAFRSAVQTLTAPARAETPTAPTIDYEDETMTGTTTGMEWGTALGQNVPDQWTPCTADMTLKALGWNGEALTVQFRTVATDSNYASEAMPLNIPARPEAPAAPTVTDKTDDSITITAASGVQYRLDEDGEWQSGTDGSLTFGSLTAGTQYTISARYPSNTTTGSEKFASAETTVKVATKTSAAAAPTMTGSYAVSSTDGTRFVYTIEPVDGAEYQMGDGDWQKSNVFDLIEPGTTVTFYVRMAETDTSEPGQAGSIEVTFSKLTGTGSVSMSGWTYGDEPSEPVTESSTNGTNEVTITYKAEGEDDIAYSEVRPSDAGTYVVRAVFPETAVYDEVTATAEFTVSPRQLTGTPSVSEGSMPGDVLTASLPGFDDTWLEYTWSFGDTEVSDNSFTIDIEHIGKSIHLAVTGTGNYTGSVSKTVEIPYSEIAEGGVVVIDTDGTVTIIDAYLENIGDDSPLTISVSGEYADSDIVVSEDLLDSIEEMGAGITIAREGGITAAYDPRSVGFLSENYDEVRFEATSVDLTYGLGTFTISVYGTTGDTVYSEVRELGGSAVVSFAYELTGGLTPETVAVFCIDGGGRELMDTWYSGGILSFRTTHHSDYEIGEYIEPEDPPFNPGWNDDDDDDYVPLPPQIVMPPRIVIQDGSGSDEITKVAACAAAAVAAAILAAFIIMEYRRK